jgi:GNAT superfamily N-acetyltransferase
VTQWSGRAYAGVEDLRRMQAATARAFAHTTLRVGDLAWRVRTHSHRELSLDIQLWEDEDGSLMGWTFFRANGGFEVFIVPGSGSDALVDEMLRVVEAAARNSAKAGDGLTAVDTFGTPDSSEGDRLVAARLERRGYRPESAGAVLTRSLDALRAPCIPAGYKLGAVQTPEQTAGRVEAHRLAFAPSEITQRMYQRVQRTWPYRGELDRVAMTDEGTVVAFCTAWLDEENAAGLLEPVGTHPEHQRRGLAKAVCLDALHVLRAAGALTAQVSHATDAARATYLSLGFTEHAPEVTFRRNLDP